MKRRKIAIAAGVCFSFFLGTLLNLLFVPGFDYHHHHHRQRQRQQQTQQIREEQDHRGDQESVEPQQLVQSGPPWLDFHQPTNPELLRQIRERHREVIHYRDLLVTWPAAGRLSRPLERRLMDLEPHKSSGRLQAPASHRETHRRHQQRQQQQQHQQQDRDSPGSPGSQRHEPLGDPDGARLLSLTPHTPLSCPAIRNASSVHYLGSGYTKAVYRAALNRTLSVALKSVDLAGHDMENCVERYRAREACYTLASYKLVKEMILLQRLRHSNILKLYGYCYQDSNDISDTLTTITELGTPLEMIQLLQTSWEERFRICLSLIHLLHYLAHSPLGSVTLLDFRPRQFVIIDGELKVTDLDDASAVETPCSSPADCFMEFPARNFTLACSVEGRCHNMNEKRNLYNAYRFFFTYLLPHSAPPSLRSLLDTVVNATGELHWGIDETLAQLEKVLYLFKSGLYLQNVTRGSVSEYKQLHDVSVREENYRCWPSYHHDGCLLSVYDLNEAMEICDSHSQCRAFVLTNQTTWTGRQLAFFKASSNHIVPDEGKITYVRMTD